MLVKVKGSIVMAMSMPDFSGDCSQDHKASDANRSESHRSRSFCYFLCGWVVVEQYFLCRSTIWQPSRSVSSVWSHRTIGQSAENILHEWSSDMHKAPRKANYGRYGVESVLACHVFLGEFLRPSPLCSLYSSEGLQGTQWRSTNEHKASLTTKPNAA